MTRNSTIATACVLVVEHSAAIRRLFEVVLRTVADPLFIVENQHQARIVLATKSIDVVVLEPHGRHQINWSLLDDLIAAAIPVVVVTSRVDERVQEEAIRRGATAFLAKPFIPAQLQMIIRNLSAANNN